jgi:hypothetical protein
MMNKETRSRLMEKSGVGNFAGKSSIETFLNRYGLLKSSILSDEK